MTDLEFVEAAITRFLAGLVENHSGIGFAVLVYPHASDPGEVRIVSNTMPADLIGIFEAAAQHTRNKVQ